MSFNISDFSLFFNRKLQLHPLPPPKKVTSSFPATPFKNWDPAKPPTFLKFGRRLNSTPPPSREGERRLCETVAHSRDVASLKLVSAIFQEIFFPPNDGPSKTIKDVVFFFHLKNSFCSQDIQIFVFPSSPLFLPVSHSFRAWPKINLKV